MKTVAQEFQGEIAVKGSRFLALIMPYEGFPARLEALKTEHRKANHLVTASRHMDTHKRVVESCKDDGEPSGTAGMPALKVLQGHDLVDIGLVVIRYFGGTKLGTGGLARAYSDAAIAAVQACVLKPWVRLKEQCFRVRFEKVSAFEKAAAALNLTVAGRHFTEDGAEIAVTGDENAVERLKKDWFPV